MNIKEAIQSIEDKCVDKFLSENSDKEKIIKEGKNKVIFKLVYKESPTSNTRSCEMFCTFINEELGKSLPLGKVSFQGKDLIVYIGVNISGLDIEREMSFLTRDYFKGQFEFVIKRIEGIRRFYSDDQSKTERFTLKFAEFLNDQRS